jgi:transposase-like protein
MFTGECIMAKRQRDPVRERQWRERVAAWAASGVSIRAFCERHQLTETTFRHWRRALRERDAASSARSVAASPKPRFVPVTVLPAGPVATIPVEVRCPSGHVVTVPMAEMTDLGPLFAALTASASRDKAVSSC